MTIVEIYDNYPINNIIGALCFRPERIVFVGGISEKQFKRRRLPVLRRFLQRKDMGDTELVYRQVRKDDLSDIMGRLEDIYQENEDCRFNVEVTGGEDLILVAIGAMCQRHPDIKLLQISSRLRSVSSYSFAEPGIREKMEVTASNSVEDNLLLHGGDIVCADGRDQLAQGWDFDKEFREDIRVMWRLLCQGVPCYKTEYPSVPGLWNRVITTLGALEGAGTMAQDGNSFSVREQDYIKYAENYCDPLTVDRYLDYLAQEGILSFSTSKGLVHIGYKNPKIRAALSKSGTVLELAVYLVFMELFEGVGDVRMGVTVDWDWESRNDAALRITEDVNTLNEFDILATSGLTPYFISCKNGRFNSDELYKLQSVAERFGAGYSRRMIITTDMETLMSDQAELIRRRAEDMGIVLIDNVHLMTPAQLRETLGKALELPKTVLN